MGGFSSKRKETTALTVAMDAQHQQQFRETEIPDTQNISLTEANEIFLEDVQWLDESEMLAQEDEDARILRDLENIDPQSLQQWLESRKGDTKMNIRIVDISYHSKFLARKTVEYTIVTDTATVKRRFRDFEALRIGLEARFPGACIPPLPPKKRILKADPRFLKQRRRLLQLFLQAVARHPYFSGDNIFIEFIASSERFDRKLAQRPRSWLVKQQRFWSVASRRWIQALQTSEAPVNPQATLEAAHFEFTAIKSYLQGLKATAKVTNHRLASVSDSLLDMAASFKKAQDEESRLLLLGGSTVSGVSGVSVSGETEIASTNLSEMLQKADQVNRDHSTMIRELLDLTDEALLCPVRFEISFIDAFFDALKRAKNSMYRHRQAVGNYRQAKELPEMSSFRQGRELNDPNMSQIQAQLPDGQLQTATMISPQATIEIDRARTKLQKLRLIAVQAQMQARRDINGLLLLELQRFRNERAGRLCKAIDAYARVQRDTTRSIKHLWENVQFLPSLQQQLHSSSEENSTTANGLNRVNSGLPPPPAAPSDAAGPTTRRISLLRALYNFEPQTSDELRMKPGDVLTEVDSSNPDWYKVTTANGQVGLVPKTYVEQVVNEDEQPSGVDDEEEEDSPEEERNNENPFAEEDDGALPHPPPTNYIKQTQDSIKGTKRSAGERE